MSKFFRCSHNPGIARYDETISLRPATSRTPLVRLDQLPPQLYFVGSAVFHYLGPAFAVLLFARVDPLGVAWLRIFSAGLFFAAWRRPWRSVASDDQATLKLLVGLGAVFAVMNSCFYLAIDRKSTRLNSSHGYISY